LKFDFSISFIGSVLGPSSTPRTTRSALIGQITTLFTSEARYYAIKNWTRQHFAGFFVYSPDFKDVQKRFGG
jgi:hypothetical protein